MASYERMVEMIRDLARAGTLPAHVVDMPLTPQTRLGDLGLDSLGKMSLLTEIMDVTDQYFSDDAFDDEDSLGRIASTVLGSEA